MGSLLATNRGCYFNTVATDYSRLIKAFKVLLFHYYTVSYSGAAFVCFGYPGKVDDDPVALYQRNTYKDMVLFQYFTLHEPP